ncbi:AbrB family transcriptional regulator [Blastococcus sp. HT6-30]|uniref:AbrB family transcriptional regulator n=1 Tax=Blastococcus sp. HT6-30 TaxID=3144843 RepID=UPI003219494B
MRSRRGARLLDAAFVVAAAAGLGLLLGLAGLPSPALFGGLVVGLVRALGVRSPARVPEPAATAAQAVIGVALGALVDVGTLRAVVANWLPVVLVPVATLLLSLLAGVRSACTGASARPCRSRWRSRWPWCSPAPASAGC